MTELSRTAGLDAPTQLAVSNWIPIDPTAMASGVPLAAPQAPLPGSWIRCPAAATTGDAMQLDIIIDCWDEPGYFLQNFDFDHRPPDYSIRFTGQFTCPLSPEGLVQMIRAVLASDAHHFVTDMDWTRSVVFVYLANAIVQIHGTIVNWTADATTSPFDAYLVSVDDEEQDEQAAAA